MMYVQIFAGFVLLLGGAEVLVRGAVALASRLGVSPLVIGMTVVALGTSAPEMVVSLDAVLSGAPGLALGNVVGSNIANVLLILGATCLVQPILTRSHALAKDALVLLGGSVVFAGLCLLGEIGFLSGTLLVAIFLGFLGYSYWREIVLGDRAAERHAAEVEEITGLAASPWLSWAALAGGLAGVIYGADLLVEGGVALARMAGIPEEVIGLTLIALGTSLPELAASVAAAVRGHVGLSIGNIVGSNLFNILGVAGTVAMVETLPVHEQIRRFDLWVMMGSTGVLVAFLIGGWRLGRLTGGVFLAGYVAYIASQALGISGIVAGEG